MLTSLFYYEHYRPYIMKSLNSRDDKTPAVKRKLAEPEKDATPSEVALNKAFNKDVVNYAKNIYRSATDLKYTAKKLSNDLKNYSKYKEHEEFEQDSFEEGFAEDLEQFSVSYNKSQKFLKNQQHSPYLGEVGERLDDILGNSEKVLSAMGMEQDEDGNLEVLPEKSTFWNGKNTEKKAKAAAKLFAGVYEEATEILDNPMSKHMNFKSLNYYYNYEVDKVHVDSFQIIKTGLLVNLAL